ncbi:YphA family membrane protein [Aureibacillus halotolerans]|uniref:Uncharacterized protein n=1 Tax=Aureibacillus halotolerans TaxID=1508390 RepID=A0A4R6U994_9BACI|nr:hypothetical protein [Aureibacillus halotolerans]TDQ41543.1 hypothetical protein EV213_103121 [Aureibacillus halotolerans]
MAPLWFLWLGWLGWILIAFFLNASAKRSFMQALVLLSIALSGLYIPWLWGTFNAGFVLLGIVSFGYLFISSNEPRLKLVSMLFASTACYAFLELFAMFDPVWVFTDRRVIFGSIMVIVAAILGKTMLCKIALYIGGMVQGSILAMLVLDSVTINTTAGTAQQLDTVGFGCAILLVLQCVALAIHKLEEIVQRKVGRQRGLW